MRKKILAIVGMIGINAGVAVAQNPEKGLGFVAPTVADEGGVADPILGEIVYDFNDNQFFGFRDDGTANGDWISLSDPTTFTGVKHFEDGLSGYGAATVTSPTSDITLSDSSSDFQIVNSDSDTRKITLPTGALVQAGRQFTILNTSATFDLDVSVVGVIRLLGPVTQSVFVALLDNPTTDAHWQAVVGADASASQSGIVNTAAQTFAGVKTFNSGINLGNDNLTSYEEYVDATGVSSECSNNATINSRGVKIGNLVTLSVILTTCTPSGSSAFISTNGTPVPASFRPSTDVYSINQHGSIFSTTQGDTLLQMRVQTTGGLQFRLLDNTLTYVSFTDASTSKVITVSYTTN